MNQYYNGIDERYISKVNGIRVGLTGLCSPRYLVATNTGIPDFVSNATRGVSS
jgi:hypothetical protein